MRSWKVLKAGLKKESFMVIDLLNQKVLKVDDDVGASPLSKSRSSRDDGREVKSSSFLKLGESLDLGNYLESCEEKTTRRSRY